VGTDDNSPIKTSGGSPIYGRMVPGSIWQQFMNAALRNKPVEQFGKFEPLGTPPDEGLFDATASENPDEEDDNGGSRHRRRDEFRGQDQCDFVACDDDGNPIGGRRNRNNDSGDN
jgi:membrane peptidoglycan carboxypeptidase